MYAKQPDYAIVAIHLTNSSGLSIDDVDMVLVAIWCHFTEDIKFEGFSNFRIKQKFFFLILENFEVLASIGVATNFSRCLINYILSYSELATHE